MTEPFLNADKSAASSACKIMNRGIDDGHKVSDKKMNKEAAEF